MKQFLMGVAVIILTATAAWAADPQVGDSKDRVLDNLGNPKGRMSIKNMEVLFYDRGSIELLDGKVSMVKLVTAEQLARQQAAQAEQEKRSAEARKKLIAEGEVEKQRLLDDPAFARKSPAEQAEAWRKFAAKYPGVSVAGEIEAANADAAEEARRKAAAVAPKAEQPLPKLSSSKLRKLRRSVEPKETDK